MISVVFSGQGSQYKGMGLALFARHPRMMKRAEEIIGDSLTRIVESGDLDDTRHTQAALFVFNALSWLGWAEKPGNLPVFAAGHSLGEYNALHAAGVFDFEIGVRLVTERGRLMAEAGNGKMAAVLGWTASELRDALHRAGANTIDLAND